MPGRCFVSGCPTGRSVFKDTHMFSTPKDPEEFKKWSLACNMNGRLINVHTKICHHHFQEDKMIKENSVTFPNGTKHITPLTRWRLLPHTVPTIFGEVSLRFPPTPIPQVNIPTTNTDGLSGTRHLQSPFLNTESVGGVSDLLAGAQKHLKSPVVIIKSRGSVLGTQDGLKSPVMIIKSVGGVAGLQQCLKTAIMINKLVGSASGTQKRLKTPVVIMNSVGGASGLQECLKTPFMISKSVGGVSGTQDHLKTPVMITKSVGNVSGLQECLKTPFMTNKSVSGVSGLQNRHTVPEPHKEPEDRMDIEPEITSTKSPPAAVVSSKGTNQSNQPSVDLSTVLALSAANGIRLETNWKKKADSFKRLSNTWRNKYYRLNNKFERIKEKNIRDGVFIPFTNLSSHEKIYATALAKKSTTKSPNSMRYTKEHLLHSLEISAQGKKRYEFLRKNGVQVLPSYRTLSKLRSKMPRVKRGLNMDVLGYMKDLFKDFDEKDRYVIIKFDEVYMNSGLQVQETDHNLIADGVPRAPDKPLENKPPTRTLVVLAESVTDKGMFLVANYPSARSLPGKEISKKLTEVIAALEKHGCAVLAVTSDATQTNKRAYLQFGIQINKGALSKYCIPNPHCPTRCIYFLHNAPHIIHCIKNYILKSAITHYFMGKVISATYLHRLLFLDEKNRMYRMCPELTAEHLKVEETYVKGKTNLATHLFNHSTANGIRYYRELGDRQMQESEATEKFIRFISDMFESLNATKPESAVRDEENSLLHNMCQSHTILTASLKKTFATRATMTSLQLTLKSAFEICTFLLREKQFDFVLTAKLNLDAVGILFGSAQGNIQNVNPEINQV